MNHYLNESIERELKRLNVSHWINAIAKIVNHFEGYPIDFDEWEPAFQILEALKRLAPKSEEELRIEFVVTVRDLECFTFRALRITDAGPRYWDPLQCSYHDFSAGGNEVRTYQGETLYPAADIIQAWFFYHIPSLRRT